MAKLGIFCLEGDWNADLRQSIGSVRSLLELMRSSGQIQAVYRDVGTVEEFAHYCGIWTRQRRYADYAVGWFAFHGEPGAIEIGRRKLSLDDIADDILGEGTCSGKSIYFGACSTAAITAPGLERFRRKTGARVVCGYTEDVDWMESAAFELLLMQTLGNYEDSRISYALRSVRKNYGGLADRLGFCSDPPWMEATR